MSYITLNSPKRLTVAFPETEQESAFVIKTVPLGGKTPSTLAKFRKVVSRTPVFNDAEESKISYFIDTMECGHQKTVYLDYYWDSKSHLVDVVPKATRHLCASCQDLQTKKPVQSVTANKKRGTA